MYVLCVCSLYNIDEHGGISINRYELARFSTNTLEYARIATNCPLDCAWWPPHIHAYSLRSLRTRGLKRKRKQYVAVVCARWWKRFVCTRTRSHVGPRTSKQTAHTHTLTRHGRSSHMLMYTHTHTSHVHQQLPANTTQSAHCRD